MSPRFGLAVILCIAFGSLLADGLARADSNVGGTCVTSATDIGHGDFRGPGESADGGWEANACLTSGAVPLSDGGTNPARAPCVPCTSNTFNGLVAACRTALRAANCP